MTQAQALSDLGLGDIFGAAVVPGRRKKADITFALAGPLEVNDLLKAGEEGSIQQPLLKDIRRSHHELAKHVAAGLKHVEISEITGYTPGRISILCNDPTFSELVEHYKGIEDESHIRSRADFHERLASLGFDSIEVLHQRLLDQPETFTATEVLKILEATADRIGHGKTSTQNLNIQSLTLDARDLAAIRDTADSGTPNPALEENRSALLRLAVRATETLPAGEEVSGGEGEGSGVREEGGEGAEETV